MTTEGISRFWAAALGRELDLDTGLVTDPKKRAVLWLASIPDKDIFRQAVNIHLTAFRNDEPRCKEFQAKANTAFETSEDVESRLLRPSDANQVIVQGHLYSSLAGAASHGLVEEALSFLHGPSSDSIPESFDETCDNSTTHDKSSEGPTVENFRLTALSRTAEGHVHAGNVDEESKELTLVAGLEVLGSNEAQRCVMLLALSSVDEIAASGGASQEDAESMKEEIHSTILDLDKVITTALNSCTMLMIPGAPGGS